MERLLDVSITGIGSSNAKLFVDSVVSAHACENHEQAILTILKTLPAAGFDLSTVSVVGHRVVHGGETLVKPVRISAHVEQIIDAMSPLAPLHNSVALDGIRAAKAVLGDCPHVAVFDTAFHATLPIRARLYALPEELNKRHSIRRFGFHGISHDYVSRKAAKALKRDLRQLRIISCHLGNGCSVTAIENGRSVETSMGMTPLEGLVMGSRAGDVDPGILIQLIRDENHTAITLDDLLNQKSGLLGMTGTNNMQEIETRAADGDESCRRAIHVFSHRVRKYVGAYAAAMGGVDAIVFTGGIGEHSPYIRHRIAQRFSFLGANLDEHRNRLASPTREHPVWDISAEDSNVKFLLIATDEESAIAQQVAVTLAESSVETSQKNIPVAISARHVHLSETTVARLFGPGYLLTPQHALSQPGQFACNETVSLVGPRNRIDNVRILGPTRPTDQVEISRSDEFYLGIDAPIRLSGDTDNTPGITLSSASDSVTISRGVICPLRHIHMHPDDATQYHVQDGDLVNVMIEGGDRDLTFSDVVIRVSDAFRLEMHIDTDEANAAGLTSGSSGALSRLNGRGQLVGA